jgi:hypothetical protein
MGLWHAASVAIGGQSALHDFGLRFGRHATVAQIGLDGTECEL